MEKEEKEDFRFKSYEDFFRLVGDNYLFPTSCGEHIFDFSIEELYQHIKERLKAEIEIFNRAMTDKEVYQYIKTRVEDVAKND